MDSELQVNKLRGEIESLKELLSRRNQEIKQLIKSNREEADKFNNENLFVSKESYESNLFGFDWLNHNITLRTINFLIFKIDLKREFDAVQRELKDKQESYDYNFKEWKSNLFSRLIWSHFITNS
jgi:hypothetical protein